MLVFPRYKSLSVGFHRNVFRCLLTFKDNTHVIRILDWVGYVCVLILFLKRTVSFENSPIAL